MDHLDQPPGHSPDLILATVLDLKSQVSGADAKLTALVANTERTSRWMMNHERRIKIVETRQARQAGRWSAVAAVSAAVSGGITAFYDKIAGLFV